MSTIVTVEVIPNCDICPDDNVSPATHDGKTVHGPWAYMCDLHFDLYGVPGVGLSARLSTEPPPDLDDADKRTAIMAAVEANDFGAFEDLIGDGDPAEWL